MNLIEAIKRVDTFKREKCKRNLSITTNNEIIEPDALIEGIYNHNIYYTYIYVYIYIYHIISLMFNPFAPMPRYAKSHLHWSCEAFPSPRARLQVTEFVQWHRDLASCDMLRPLPYQHSKYLEISRNISKHLKALGAGCHLRQLFFFRQWHSLLHPPTIFGDLWRGFCTTQCKPEQVDRSCFIFPSQVRYW